VSLGVLRVTRIRSVRWATASDADSTAARSGDSRIVCGAGYASGMGKFIVGIIVGLLIIPVVLIKACT
jgi:hypothetical protein